MSFLFFLWSWTLCQPILALSIPRYDAQSPMLNEPHPAIRPNLASVILGFSASGSDEVEHVQIPLQKQTLSGADLPTHPEMIRIEAMVNQQGQSVSLETLDLVMCRVVLELSAEEKAALELMGSQKVLPWFRLKDGAVLLEESSSRWFLAGRSIATYECR
ncbi:hypothetical protein CC86DRAFT_405473 [Ophiobolus disseminans]|uniref:Ig-like domain-containing protein n=1 Tax=Ophiobolus disseminans TaxID=1469910 RepID=A0A6A7A3K6_9PLEO|nr:hypothetical protein CC86DRAFT_405473 [Ophiobolus disseminans]